MTGFSFESLSMDNEYVWPDRGRREAPLPEELVQALQKSYQDGIPAKLIIRSEDIKRFGALLTKAGSKLNMRIERDIQPNTPKEGYAQFAFRARVKNSNKVVEHG